MDFYHMVFFHPHLCSLLLKSAGVAGVNDGVIPFLIPIVAKMHHCTWSPPTANPIPLGQTCNPNPAKPRLLQFKNKQTIQQDYRF